MEQILKELNKENPVIIEIEQLPDFWNYCKTQKHRFAFTYEYQETTVKITISKHTIFIQSSINAKTH